MPIAALYDIHGNLPALEAVLQDLRRAGVDQVVVGGDVLPGPFPRQCLQRLLELDRPAHFIHGNGELAVLAQLAARQSGTVTYWGTTSGAPLPEPLRAVYTWTMDQLDPAHEAVLAGWPRTLQLEIDGLGPVLFCHATPRSETEVFTRLTPAERLEPLLDGLPAGVVVCGHTHMPFDRAVGRKRVVNAGSVGQPFGTSGAAWLLLGPGIDLCHTDYDLEQAAERIRASGYPQADDYARAVLQPEAEAAMLEVFTKWELR